MTIRPDGSRGGGRRSGAARVERLAEAMAVEMAAAWERGVRPPAEEYLARHPELCDHPDAAARLIYEEICLREGRGEAWERAEILRRFPDWRPELEILFDCHELVRPPAAGPAFPEVGESLGDYRLLAELGRGVLGRIFLAAQSTLADRPVVLKVTRRCGGEHLSMARLQHPNIMPLYAVHDFPDRGLRALCMPYLGGATLARVFERFEGQPPGRRTGEGLLQILDTERTELVPLPSWSTTRQFLSGVTYVRAVCWLAARLADALHCAHERGLLHLDLKPSNILVADDGQPMLLDFHLAQGPVQPGGAIPGRMGGTRGYMSPEQEAALRAVEEGRPLSMPLDRRSDVYSLGVILYEALVGEAPGGQGGRPIDRPKAATHISVGLVDILAKALAPDLRSRYPSAAALALDLRKHLERLPLHGVANRSLKERWSKWWKRHAHARP